MIKKTKSSGYEDDSDDVVVDDEKTIGGQRHQHQKNVAKYSEMNQPIANFSMRQ